jgi:hypothetical protein
MITFAIRINKQWVNTLLIVFTNRVRANYRIYHTTGHTGPSTAPSRHEKQNFTIKIRGPRNTFIITIAA